MDGPTFKEHLLASGCIWAKFQLEEAPTTKTPHFQGAAKWKNQVRGSTLTKRFTGIWVQRLADWDCTYGTKDETRIGGPWAIGTIAIRRPLKSLREDQLYQWQLNLWEVLKAPCEEDRIVNWFWEYTGKVGKSAFARFVRDQLGEGSVLLLDGRPNDMFYQVAQVIRPDKGEQLAEVQVIFMDFERGEEANIQYDVLGKLKNGWVTSTKYQSRDVRFPPVHVVCFANFPPRLDAISADRWNIVEIPADARD